MLRFSLFRIPVSVDWWFWLACVLISGQFAPQDKEDWTDLAIWSLVVFVSIIVHELGHALAGRRYGLDPAIRLHGFGGTTYLPGAHLGRKESIIVSAAGPLAGLWLGFVILGLSRYFSDGPWLLRVALLYGLYINFVWTIINLLPIQPLDGGQILRESLGPRWAQLTRWIGFVLAVSLCLWALSTRRIFSAFMLAMLAYYNFRQEPIEGGVVRE